MISCTRIFRFEAAHRLYGHKGACANIHGHSYKVEVTATAPKLDELGMVVDFGDLKEAIGDWLDDYWDHACILNEDDPIARLFVSVLEGKPLDNMKYFAMTGNPTAENMARCLLKLCKEIFFADCPITVTKVTVWETENCFATAEV